MPDASSAPSWFEFVKRRSGIDRLAERQPRAEIEAAARAFDPDVLTIGFARRNATYKRIRLLIQDPGRALRLLAGPYRIQLVLAGKAHPSDDDAKRVIQELYRFKDLPDVTEHVVFLHDYDLGTAARMVRGCDLWLNLPRPPLEASGTSGMKAVINGGLHLSVLDGWWAEAYGGTNGWALPGDVHPDPGAQDARDAGSLYDLFEQEVRPAFYDRDADGLPLSWLSRIRASMRTLAPAFCTRANARRLRRAGLRADHHQGREHAAPVRSFGAWCNPLLTPAFTKQGQCRGPCQRRVRLLHPEVVSRGWCAA